MDFRFLHTADIHLDSPMRGLARPAEAPLPEIQTVTRRALAGLVDAALKLKVDFVIIAGDLFDGSWKDFATGFHFQGQMARLQAGEIPVFIAKGNHDSESVISRELPLPPNCRVFGHREPETFLVDNLPVALHGQSFATKAVTDDLSVNYPQALPDRFNIGVLHTSTTGREGHEPYAPCTAAGLQSHGYSYWALGHVHSREIVSDNPWIIYPGCLQSRHIREEGAKGCTLVTVQGGRIIQEPQHVSVDVLRFQRLPLPLHGSADYDEFLTLVFEKLQEAVDGAEGRSLVLRIVLEGQTTLHEVLISDPEQVRRDIMAQMIAVNRDELGLEKLEIQTRPAQSADDGFNDQFFEELLPLTNTWQLDRANEVWKETMFKELERVMPYEIKTQLRSLRDDPDQWLTFLQEVEHVLIAKIREEVDNL